MQSSSDCRIQAGFTTISRPVEIQKRPDQDVCTKKGESNKQLLIN